MLSGRCRARREMARGAISAEIAISLPAEIDRGHAIRTSTQASAHMRARTCTASVRSCTYVRVCVLLLCRAPPVTGAIGGRARRGVRGGRVVGSTERCGGECRVRAGGRVRARVSLLEVVAVVRARVRVRVRARGRVRARVSLLEVVAEG